MRNKASITLVSVGKHDVRVGVNRVDFGTSALASAIHNTGHCHVRPRRDHLVAVPHSIRKQAARSGFLYLIPTFAYERGLRTVAAENKSPDFYCSRRGLPLISFRRPVSIGCSNRFVLLAVSGQNTIGFLTPETSVKKKIPE
jgi:hypothetical protein